MQNSLYKTFFIFSILYVFVILPAQGTKQDSLRHLIGLTKDNIEKVNLLNELSRVYWYKNNNEESFKLGYEALVIAKANNNKIGIGESYNILGSCYFMNNNYSEALENYFYAEVYLKKTSSYLGLAKVYRNIALVFKTLKNPTECIKFSKLSLDNLKKQVDDDLKTDCYYYLATSYNLLENHKIEVQYLVKSIELRKKNKQWKKLGNEYNNLGISCWNNRKYDEALSHFNIYLKLSIQFKDSINIARAYSNIGETFLEKSEYSKSIISFSKAISLKQSNISRAYLGLVESYCKLNKLDKASYYFSLAKDKRSELKSLIDACKLLAETCAKSNKDKSIYYYNTLYTLKDSLHKSSIKDIQINLKVKYEIQEMEERMKEKANQELLQAKINNKFLQENLSLQGKYNQLMIVISILLIIILGGIIYISRRKSLVHRLTAEQLKRESLSFQFESLKNQVNPHFLFNSLNVLIGLLYKNPDDAVKFVKGLSQVYRYVLKNKNDEIVYLEKELEFIKSFVYLLKIRFNDSLIIDINLMDTNEICIAPLTLQMLIENAIKHNIFSIEKPLKIDIFELEEFIVISNNIQLKEQKEEISGIGINNLKNRYSFLTNKEILILNDQIRFTVKVPKL